MLRCGLWLLGCVTLLLVVGCPAEDYQNAVSTTLDAINRIRNDTSLTAQEMRTQLADLGLDSSTINALLKSQRLGNQFGGDLRTAYEKVVGGQLSSLTPDEVQIYGDEATTVVNDSTTLSVAYTDTEAQAVLDFFVQNQINTVQELSAYLNDSSNTVPATIPSGTLQGLFVDFDPSKLLSVLP
jgi:hypothetical protein